MKKTLLLVSIYLGLSSSTLFAQCAISNTGFETWQTDSVSSLSGKKRAFQRPVDWSPFASLLFSLFSGSKPGIYQSTDAYRGSSSLELRADPRTADSVLSGGDAMSLLACSSNPTQLTGYVSTEGLDSKDSAFVVVIITNAQKDTVGEGFTRFVPNNKTWTPFSCPIQYKNTTGVLATVLVFYMPDNVTTFKSVKVDALAFSSAPTSLFDQTMQDKIAVFPNPFKDQLTLQRVKEGDALKVYDLSGNEVKTLVAPSNEPSISLGDLANGVYFVEHSLNGLVHRVKVIKN